MKSFFYQIVLVFTVVSCNIISGHCEIFSDETESYNFQKSVANLAKRISVRKNGDILQDSNGDFVSNYLFPNKTINPLILKLLINKASLKCLEDVVYMFENLKSLGWAAKMLDSYGKPESGILSGNIRWPGDYRECLDIYAPPQANKSNVGDFHGKYCSLKTDLNVTVGTTMSFVIGTCLPDSCAPSAYEMNFNKLRELFPNFDEEYAFPISDIKLTCPSNPEKFSPGAIAVICLVSVFLLLAVIGSFITVYEIIARAYLEKDLACCADVEYQSQASGDAEHTIQDSERLLHVQQKVLPTWLGKCKPFFNCFCFLTNGEKLLNTDSNEGQLPSLHGIRFLSMSWVILCHTYMFSYTAVRNPLQLLPVIDHWHFQIILNGFFSVDSFFVLSGFLVAYLFFQESAKKNGKIPWVYFYVHRYIRLTPVYMIVLGFYAAMFPYLGSGPFWTTFTTDANCKAHWWWNLLYINNFQDTTEQCMGWAWYLANDMQFYVISPILLITLWRWPVKIGYLILGLFLSVTFVTNFAITYHYDLPAGLGDVVNEASDIQKFIIGWSVYFDKIYIKPYTRMSPYLIGIAVAYCVFRIKQNKSAKNSSLTLCCGWIITSGITLTCLFGTYNRELSLIETSFYNALSRSCFSCGLCWVIFVCCTGQGGFVNKFLSWKLFVPLSRLTFCAYLVHPVVQYVYFQSVKILLDCSNITIIGHFLVFLFVSYTIAFITSVLFESPLIRLEKVVRNKFAS